MAERAIRLPDVGEGVAEAELVEWHVKIGDVVGEDDILAAVMTDKATVEIPSPIAGEIVWLAAGSRVKSRLVENDTQPVADGFGLYDVRVELKQVRIVVIKPLGFHQV